MCYRALPRAVILSSGGAAAAHAVRGGKTNNQHEKNYGNEEQKNKMNL